MCVGMSGMLMMTMRALMRMKKWLYRRPHLPRSIILVF